MWLGYGGHAELQPRGGVHQIGTVATAQPHHAERTEKAAVGAHAEQREQAQARKTVDEGDPQGAAEQGRAGHLQQIGRAIIDLEIQRAAAQLREVAEHGERAHANARRYGAAFVEQAARDGAAARQRAAVDPHITTAKGRGRTAQQRAAEDLRAAGVAVQSGQCQAAVAVLGQAAGVDPGRACGLARRADGVLVDVVSVRARRQSVGPALGHFGGRPGDGFSLIFSPPGACRRVGDGVRPGVVEPLGVYGKRANELAGAVHGVAQADCAPAVAVVGHSHQLAACRVGDGHTGSVADSSVLQRGGFHHRHGLFIAQVGEALHDHCQHPRSVRLRHRGAGQAAVGGRGHTAHHADRAAVDGVARCRDARPLGHTAAVVELGARHVDRAVGVQGLADVDAADREHLADGADRQPRAFQFGPEIGRGGTRAGVGIAGVAGAEEHGGAAGGGVQRAGHPGAGPL